MLAFWHYRFNILTWNVEHVLKYLKYPTQNVELLTYFLKDTCLYNIMNYCLKVLKERQNKAGLSRKLGRTGPSAPASGVAAGGSLFSFSRLLSLRLSAFFFPCQFFFVGSFAGRQGYARPIPFPSFPAVRNRTPKPQLCYLYSDLTLYFTY